MSRYIIRSIGASLRRVFIVQCTCLDTLVNLLFELVFQQAVLCTSVQLLCLWQIFVVDLFLH